MSWPSDNDGAVAVSVGLGEDEQALVRLDVSVDGRMVAIVLSPAKARELAAVILRHAERAEAADLAARPGLRVLP